MLAPEIAARLKRTPDGLITAVAQQHDTGEVLMVAWMNDDALEQTLTTGRAVYWSRSRGELWRKGDTSGNVQRVVSVSLDCDGDALLVHVDQVGPACHTGYPHVLRRRRRPWRSRWHGPVGADARSRFMTAVRIEWGQTWPSREEFKALGSSRRVVPVVRRVLADSLTPVAVYRALAGGRPGTFILESAEPDGSRSRWSFVGVRSSATLTIDGDDANWAGEVPVGLADGAPLDAIRRVLAELQSEPIEGLPPLTGGMVGVIGWDIIRQWEPTLPHKAPKDIDVPDAVLALATDVAAIDHHDGSVWLIANAVNADAQASGHRRRLRRRGCARRRDAGRPGIGAQWRRVGDGRRR